MRHPLRGTPGTAVLAVAGALVAGALVAGCTSPSGRATGPRVALAMEHAPSGLSTEEEYDDEEEE